MHALTGGADMVQDFTVELPPHWRRTECSVGLRYSEGAVRADLVVTAPHPLHGDTPHAVQHGGCGVAAARLEIPHNLFTKHAEIAPDQLTAGLAALVVGFSVHIKFDETYNSITWWYGGRFTGLIIQIILSRGICKQIRHVRLVKFTLCCTTRVTSILHQIIFLFQRWRYGVFGERGVAEDAMFPLNSTAGGETVENSGCSLQQLQQGGGLCPLSGYNNGANTKQNLLCSKLSARRSIQNQFSAKHGAKFVKPRIKFVMPLDTKRVILILDQSAAMAPNWRSVLASTFQFINSLPEGTELAVISYSATARVHLEPTRVEGGNREGLHYRIPRRLPSTEDGAASCPDCAIELAMNLATNTTSIVVLSSYVYFDKQNISKLMEFEQSANPILHRVQFGTAAGPHQHIHNNVFLINGHQNMLNITSRLSLALSSLMDDFPSQKFHHELLPATDLQGSFSVEASLSSDLWLQLLVEDTTDINVFEVRSPSGQVFAFPKFDAGLVYFSLRGPRETGVWSYRVKLYSGRQAGAGQQLLLECWAAGSRDRVGVTSWSEGGAGPSQPVLLYAGLQQDRLPVAGAVVEAVVQQGDTYTTVPLVDTGSGYPDITRGDGIYSGYFTQFSGEPGQVYSVTVRAVNNNSATVVNPKKLENATLFDLAGVSAWPLEPSVPLESFIRFVAAPSFSVQHGSEFSISANSVQRKDVFPPNRITDFRLASYFNNSLFVTLSWTAPGDDFTLGTAFRYEIRCFTAAEALSEDNFGEQGILVHSSLVPSPDPAGTEQRCTVGVPWPNEVFYYAIVAFDAAGNRAEVSNSIAVLVPEPVTSTSQASTIMFSNMKDVSSTLPLKSFIHSESLMYIIAGIISLILIIIVIILTVIIRRLGGCGKKNDPGVAAASSLPDLCSGDQPGARLSVSYISGYHLPEMLEYALRSPASGVAVGGGTVEPVPAPPPPQSPSVSPVHSNYGQSTDCSVSVSGSDHELCGEATLQVVTRLQPRPRPPHCSTLQHPQRTHADYSTLSCSHDTLQTRPEPKPRKIPPAVPNKTVHASLV